MSIERHRQEVKPQGLPNEQQTYGLSPEFYKHRQAQHEAEKAQQKKEKHDHQQGGGDKENEGISTRGSGNNYNQQIDYNATHTNRNIPIDEYYSSDTLKSVQKLEQFFKQAKQSQTLDQLQAAWAQEQVTRAQTLDSQIAEMQTAPNSEISKSVPQEGIVNPDRGTKRKALEDTTKASTNGSDTRDAKRAKIDKPQIDENIANPKTEMGRKALAKREMDLPEIDREKIKEQVKAESKQDRQKEQKLAQQELAKRLQYQGVIPPTSDAQQPDTKSTDSDSKPDTQLSQKQAALNDALTHLGQADVSLAEGQNLMNTIHELQNAIQADKGKLSDAQRHRI
ncbi:MAG TPA: hypothetical protein VGL94_22400 [Ktedonobacteraceae bacterium]|jgi:hypothetical protein